VGLAVTVVKGTRLLQVPEVTLDEAGAVGDRRFFVMDDQDRMVNGKRLGALSRVVAELSGDELSMRFPSGGSVSAPVRLGEAVRVRFHSRTVEGRRVEGPWAQALTEHAGQPLKLVEGTRRGPDRGAGGGISLVSRASLARLAAETGHDTVDARRFRMLVEIDGVGAHGEDAWVARSAWLGEARVRFAGHVGRCLVTSRNAETGEIDLPTLDVLRRYRGAVESTEPLPFGIYGRVMRGGIVRVGDELTLVE
jgi:uncharacterized protein